MEVIAVLELGLGLGCLLGESEDRCVEGFEGMGLGLAGLVEVGDFLELLLLFLFHLCQGCLSFIDFF